MGAPEFAVVPLKSLSNSPLVVIQLNAANKRVSQPLESRGFEYSARSGWWKTSNLDAPAVQVLLHERSNFSQRTSCGSLADLLARPRFGRLLQVATCCAAWSASSYSAVARPSSVAPQEEFCRKRIRAPLALGGGWSLSLAGRPLWRGRTCQ